MDLNNRQCTRNGYGDGPGSLDYAKYDNGDEMVTKRICIHEGKNSSYHYHNLRDEVWTIVRGEGELALDDHITRVKAGDIIHLPAGKKHGIKALSELEFIEVQTGMGISNEDFTRLYFVWEDVIGHFNKSKSKVIIIFLGRETLVFPLFIL